MRKIKLDAYKSYYIYFILFNSYIKSEKIKKQALFDSLDISFSSYTRCSEKDTKVTKEIYDKLCDEFNIVKLNIKRNSLIEEKINDIYYSIYYKTERDYENDIAWLDSLIKEKYTIYPIALLFKLFILINIIPPRKLMEKYTNLFNEVEAYKLFFIEELSDIYFLVELAFKRDFIPTTKEIYENDLIYQMLAALYYLKEEYNTAFNYANKALIEFLKDKNYIRATMADLIIMGCYNQVKQYKKAYILAIKCYQSVKGFNKLANELDFINLQIVISCLGLKRYKEGLRILESKIGFNINDCLAYVILNKKLNIDINWECLLMKINKYKNIEEILNKLKEYYYYDFCLDEFIIDNKIFKVFIELHK